MGGEAFWNRRQAFIRKGQRYNKQTKLKSRAHSDKLAKKAEGDLRQKTKEPRKTKKGIQELKRHKTRLLRAKGQQFTISTAIGGANEIQIEAQRSFWHYVGVREIDEQVRATRL